MGRFGEQLSGAVALIIGGVSMAITLTGTIAHEHHHDRKVPIIPPPIPPIVVEEVENFLFLTLTTAFGPFPIGTTVAVNEDFILIAGPVSPC